MKRILVAGALVLAGSGLVFAADLPPAAEPPPRAPATYVPTVAPVYDWSGIYVGLNGGYGFGDSNWTAPGIAPTGNFDVNGGVIGGTIGYNFQWSSFVFGIEADLDWADLKGNSSVAACGVGAGVTCETESEWLGTVRARLGWAWDRVLFYGTAGGAAGNIQAGLNPPETFDTSTEFGWTVGAGVEYAITDNFTARIEYLYVDLSNGTCNVNCSFAVAPPPTSVSLTESLARVGVDFKFNAFQ
jgi:outer membrane immunogenic protein